MTGQYITDIAAADKTGYRPSADVCRWTAVDADGISANTDAKISASARLCDRRLSTEIKWHYQKISSWNSKIKQNLE